MKSVLLNSRRIISSGRWDYDYNQESYVEFEQLLESLPTAPLQDLTKYPITKGETPLWKGDKYVNEDEGVLFIRSENIRDHGLDLGAKTFIPQLVHKRMKRSQIKPKDILLAIVGATIGQVAVVPEDIVAANCNQAVSIIRLKDDINPLYIQTVLKSSFGQTQIRRFSGGSARPNLDLWEVRLLRIPLLARKVQDRIAQIMQAAYETRKQKLLEITTVIKDIDDFVFAELGINVDKIIRPKSSFKHISEIAGGRFDFEAVMANINLEFNGITSTSLNTVAKKVTEHILPPKECPDDDVNYISLGHIEANTGEIVDFEPVKGTEVLSSSTKFSKGDILFGRMRPYLNKVWTAEFDGICTGEAIVLRPDLEKVDTAFLHALLMSRLTLNQIIPFQSGTSLPRVSPSHILDVKLPIPEDLNFQKKISAEIIQRRNKAKQLKSEFEQLVISSRKQVERIILGEAIE